MSARGWERNRVTITQDARGWWLNRHGLYPTAAEALAAVRAFDAERATETGCSQFTVIEWEPTTSVGRSVVRVLAGVTP